MYLEAGTGQRIHFRLEISSHFPFKLSSLGHLSLSKIPYSCLSSNFVSHECLQQASDTLIKAQPSTKATPSPGPANGLLSDCTQPPRKKCFQTVPPSPRWTSGVALHHSSSSDEFLQHPSTSVLCFRVQPCCFHTFCLAWQAFIKTSMSSCWSSVASPR